MSDKALTTPITDIRKFFEDKQDLGFVLSAGARQNYVFTHLSEFIPCAVVKRGPTEQLLQSPNTTNWLRNASFKTDFGNLTLHEYVTREERIDAVIVLEKDEVLFEHYNGMGRHDRHAIMSVTKPMTGLLAMIAEQRGLLDFTAPVGDYVSSLRKSDWAGIAVRDLLDMCAGIEGSEDDEGGMSDLQSPNLRYEAAMATLSERSIHSVFDVVATLKSIRPAGEAYSYVSANSFVLAWILEEIWNISFAEIISREIWQPMGAEADALCAVSHHGGPGGDAGISALLRDLARFGLCFASPSIRTSNPVLSDFVSRIQKSGRTDVYLEGDGQKLPIDDRPLYQNLHWDKVWADGDFFKAGWGGQGLHISPSNNLTIAYFGTVNDQRIRHNFQDVARAISRYRS